MIEDRVESAKLRGLAKRGMAWAALGQGGTVGLHYVIMLVLAWRLAPAEFGLVGLATIFVFTVNAVAELGLGAAIVQRRELRPGHVGAVFWLSLAAGIGLASGLWAAAAPIAALMREPRLVSVLRKLAADRDELGRMASRARRFAEASGDARRVYGAMAGFIEEAARPGTEEAVA